MMKVMLALCALAVAPLACDGSDGARGLPDASLTVMTSADLTDLAPAQSVPMTAAVRNVYLVAPTATPPAAHAGDAGHLEFYFDDEATPALLVTAETSVSFTIPATAAQGPHEIICRVHRHDETPTDVVFVLDVDVTSVTATTSGPPAAAAGTPSTAIFCFLPPPRRPPPRGWSAQAARSRRRRR